MADTHFELDALVVGGGIAGLLTLDALHQRGVHAWLIEQTALGHGQTVWSQGIVHGGLKYALGGSVGEAAKAVSAMPDRWRAMLDGDAEPNLSAVTMRAQACAIWSTGSAASMVGLLGAKLTLQSAPKAWPRDSIPQALSGVRGRVLRVAEPVLEPEHLMSVLGTMHHDRMMLGCVSGIDSSDDGTSIRVDTSTGPIDITCRHLCLLSGSGNEALRELAGLTPGRMQTRPLRMVLAHGDLPVLNGHCIRGTKPWLTITTVADDSDGRIWQIGGEVAEWGATESSTATIERATAAVATALPSLELSGIEWATYEAPRAERSTDDGGRPDTPAVLEEGCMLTGWPTKMALAPILADDLAGRIRAGAEPTNVPKQYERPTAATPPWREVEQWTSVHSDIPA